MSFCIQGLSPAPFAHLFGLPDEALHAAGARRVVAASSPGYPDRTQLRDAEPGESLLLVNYLHQPADTPYRAGHAIYVLEGSTTRFEATDQVPEVLRRRLLSLRGFDAEGMLRDADVVDGVAVETVIERLFANPEVAYIQVHFAKPGCYAARIERA